MTDVKTTPLLWHYTCRHGHDAIRGWLHPGTDGMIWLTDLDAPIRDALGLTMHLTNCDRTEYRYAVLDTSEVVPWWLARKLPDVVEPARREALETARGAMPMHWWVAATPVPVTYAPRRSTVRS